MTIRLLTSMRHAFLLATIAITLAAPAQAQTTIAAPLTTSIGPLSRGSAGFQSFGQSFVVPTLAPQLSSFSLSFSNFFNGGALRFDAYLYAFDTANRRVTGSALWNFLDVGGSSNDFAFDMKTFGVGGVTLSPGATYLFLVTTSNQGGIPADASNLVGGNDTNAYADGSFWIASNGASTSTLFETGAFSAADGVTDAGFSAVFLGSQQVVPEPATVLLTSLGLVGLLFIRRVTLFTREPRGTRWRAK
ncbi:MAG: PEP-CTERM sorting domain-containing protein [Gemmatimonadaceae bacterium]|nr:PEP-CTERM sorting domain-containing protein [Gemmatimonadaceae bacterium]